MRGGRGEKKRAWTTYIYVGAGRTCVLAPMTFRDSSKGGTFWTEPPIFLLLAQVPNQKEMDKRDIYLVFLCRSPLSAFAIYLSLCFAKPVVKISLGTILKDCGFVKNFYFSIYFFSYF